MVVAVHKSLYTRMRGLGTGNVPGEGAECGSGFRAITCFLGVEGHESSVEYVVDKQATPAVDVGCNGDEASAVSGGLLETLPCEEEDHRNGLDSDYIVLEGKKVERTDDEYIMQRRELDRRKQKICESQECPDALHVRTKGKRIVRRRAGSSEDSD